MNKLRYTIIFLLSILISSVSFAAEKDEKIIVPFNEIKVETVHIGEIKISTLSEGQRDGKVDILLNASPEDIEKYLPERKYLSAVNAFLVSTSEGYVLVDTGFGRELFKNLKKLNISPTEIKAVLLTHMHGDHIGGLLQNGEVSFPNADIYVATKELDYWKDKDAAQTLAPYQNRVKTFDPNEWPQKDNFLFKEIFPIAAYGHTPGHTMYLIQSRDQEFLIWGDLAHVMPLQIPIPSIAVTYDIDSVQAVKTRKEIFAYLVNDSTSQILIGGMHIPKSGMGFLRLDESENYQFFNLR